MWLIDDSFLYFTGVSEIKIEDIKINNKKIIRELNSEEQEQINLFNLKRLEKRIDLLFFPEEGECIIIELKSPNVGLQDGANQMSIYAKLIANFLSEDFKINQFYTYLITDSFTKYDTPIGYKKIYGIDGFVNKNIDIENINTHATIANQYSEVIRYTDIYKRTLRRNNIFFEKLSINK